MDTYLNVYKGYYFTGDGAGRDHEGYYWIRGRVDDVVNVSGHRLSTAEIEAALLENKNVGECAVVGINDELTGQAVNAFVSLKDGGKNSPEDTKKELVMQVRKSIGPFAAPKAIFVIPDLPKTRSGKIMRRIMRKILSGEEDQLGDTSTVSLFVRDRGDVVQMLTYVYSSLTPPSWTASSRSSRMRRSEEISIDTPSWPLVYVTDVKNAQTTRNSELHRPAGQYILCAKKYILQKKRKTP